MDRDPADGESGMRHGQNAPEAPGVGGAAGSQETGAQEPSERVKAAAQRAERPASEIEPAPPRQKAQAKAKPKAKPAAQPRAKTFPRPQPQFPGVKRLRRDEYFSVCGPECTTRDTLIRTFAEEFRFPPGWTLSWASFEQHMTNLRWLMAPWPPRRAAFLTIIDADYLLVHEPAELVPFSRALEAARQRSALPFEFEGLVRTEEAMARIVAAQEEALNGR